MPSFGTERSDTYSVSVCAPPRFVWQTLARIEDWPEFSPFARAIEPTEDPRSYRVTTPGTTLRLRCHFDPERLLLDHRVSFPDGSSVFIPYRVVPNHEGSELIMTNVKSPGDSSAAYELQLRWMRAELDGARDWVVQQHLTTVSAAGRP